MNDKRGQTLFVKSVLVVLVLAVISIGVLYSMNARQSIADREKAAKEKSEPAPPASESITLANGCIVPKVIQGESATVSTHVFDWSNTNTGTKGTGTDVYLQKEDGTIVTGTTSSSNLLTLSGFNVGDKIKIALAYNATVYGTPKKDICVNKKDFTIDGGLITYREAQAIKFTFKGNDSTSNEVTSVNLLADVANSEKVTELKLEQNNSNRAYFLKGLYVDTAESTNLTASGITFNTPASVVRMTHAKTLGITGTSYSLSNYDGTDLKSTSTDNIRMVFAEPILLLYGDEITIPGVTFETDGDGITSTGENATFYTFDVSNVKSVKFDKILENVVEDDADSPADVGASDIGGATYSSGLFALA